jgi:hypothetical protein
VLLKKRPAKFVNLALKRCLETCGLEPEVESADACEQRGHRELTFAISGGASRRFPQSCGREF